MISLSRSIRYSFSLGIGLVLWWVALPVEAAEQVVLKYKVFRESVSVQELSTFSETGELSPSLQSLFSLAQQDPEQVRRSLNQEVQASPVVLDRLLNSFVGGFLLEQVSQTVHTPSDQANHQALRAALVLSSAKDNRLSLMEVIQNYPTNEVEVEGERLLNAYLQLKGLEERLQNLL